MKPDQPTLPNPALQPRKGSVSADSIPRPVPAPRSTIPAPPLAQRQPPRPSTKAKRRGFNWLWLIPLSLILVLGGIVLTLGAATMLIYGSGILPGVEVAGISLGSLSEQEAEQVLREKLETLILRDRTRTWRVAAADTGIQFDFAATADRAYAQGRGAGGALSAILGTVDVAPVVTLDDEAAVMALNAMRDNFAIAPVDAGVRLVNGTVEATPPQTGRSLDAQATIAGLLRDPGAAFEAGALTLVMRDVQPAVTDSSPVVAQAQALLTRPLDIRVWDPVTDDSIYWSLPPEQWAAWLTAIPDSNSPIGLSLSADETAVRDYLTAKAAQSFDETRSIDVEQAVSSVRSALAAGDPGAAYVRVQHDNRTHVVRAGETITSIAWDYGVPYLYIQQLNGGLENPAVGQSILIPPADEFLLVDPVPNKRVVVSISQQRTWVYENGQLKWEWLSSTGISDSPTWPGVYQIISHERNAYAGNWNLHMPWFMGVYQPVPGADFTNGFHGFPTRGGGQILWENSLGRRVTYGCILLSNDSVQKLWDWAETGVVVEIQA